MERPRDESVDDVRHRTCASARRKRDSEFCLTSPGITDDGRGCQLARHQR
jgi:hypothetical protein